MMAGSVKVRPLPVAQIGAKRAVPQGCWCVSGRASTIAAWANLRLRQSIVSMGACAKSPRAKRCHARKLA